MNRVVTHLFPYEKFAFDYIQKINKLFGRERHSFYIYGKKVENELEDLEFENVIFIDKYSKIKRFFILRRAFMESHKVIIHLLPSSRFLLGTIDCFINKYSDKFFWNIWGADLYNSYFRNKKYSVSEIMRRFFIRNVKAVGYIPSDYEFLKQHYKTNAKFYLASYMYDFFDIESKSDTQVVNVMIANSATKECQHKEAIDLLSEYSNLEFKVFCILSYPKSNVEYRDCIIDYGREKLGGKFIPVIDYMNYKQYQDLLSTIDIAIFNHNRQQGLGNIASLLYLGKKVFINPENGCKDYFERLGAVVFDINQLNENDLKKDDIEEFKDKNKKCIQDFFSDEQFKKRWELIFEDKY